MGDVVGTNFDPGHQIWQMIDRTRLVKEFEQHMPHVHFKDVMIGRDRLYENGVLSVGMGWPILRLCGLGDVHWPDFFSAPYQAGCDGPAFIEHEDRLFEGSDERIRHGFALAPFTKQRPAREQEARERPGRTHR